MQAAQALNTVTTAAAAEGEFRPAEQTQPLDLEALSAHLDAAGLPLGRHPPLRQFAGGLGNWNYLLEVAGRPMVLRRPPAGVLAAGANDMAREHRILRGLNPVFPLAPASPHFCPDPTVIGAPFVLIEYRAGQVPRVDLPAGLADHPAERADLADQALQVLVALHRLDPASAGLDTLGRPEGMLQRQVHNWFRRAEAVYGQALPPGLLALQRYLDRPAPLAQRVSLLHSDFKLDNLIVDPASRRPLALIDWDMGTRGDPLLDLATLLSYWCEPGDPPAMQALRQMPTHLPGFPSRETVKQQYALATGLDLAGFKYHRVLALFKLVVVFRQLFARHQRGEPVPADHARFGPLSDGLLDFSRQVVAEEH